VINAIHQGSIKAIKKLKKKERLDKVWCSTREHDMTEPTCGFQSFQNTLKIIRQLLRFQISTYVTVNQNAGTTEFIQWIALL
jgi:hypothetical protein